ncbi:ribosomal large subunit pseudouridine synthase D [Proteiniborus sp. DW1]|uniref:RluA family pseudouridine synthase n=1 Tax=Proteiniborus sp. DW1 TaxID=1889883 RepID=UPI00092E06B9|nr:RluA family pseudouridine synthase [Proteiniborus sp. DW1]SCG83069.1 ribosomal large subunit pseudouridine synthase D [Proteiniborus sp. DW1]
MKESESVIIFNVKESGLTIEEVLKQGYGISGRLYRRLQKNQQLYLNGKTTKANVTVNKGDKIAILMEEEVETSIPVDIPLDIIHEDFDLIILNKQPNIVVHPTKSHQDDTIANGVAYYFNKKNISKKVRFVNRLDMGTSGILVIAKNAFTHQQMSKQMEEGTIEKKYLTIVDGVVDKDEDIIDLPIGKEDDEPMIRAVMENGQVAITKYKVVERFNKATLLEIEIETGRTHQIRVHMKHIGHPIIGDHLYNEPSDLINRQALHAYKFKFIHPRTGEEREIIAKMPSDMETLIAKL